MVFAMDQLLIQESWVSLIIERLCASQSNDGFDDFSGLYKGSPRPVSLDDDADAVSFGFRGLWTPNAKDTVELQFGVNNSDVGIGRQDYIQREIDYDYQHLNWSRINSKWQQI